MMKQIFSLIAVLTMGLIIAGCANQPELGGYVASIRVEQTYNPRATNDNLGVIPTGSGERMEGAYQVYTGLEVDDLKGTESQFLEGFGSAP
ncbi:hypothetical protein AB2S62_11460 [Vibrio sp. NTOU-M3]|uniref:hypothetical protein n=1 Tax=Vibrio sp. NTOU-M3 TaxID=3234954 RepID=UPI0035A904BF